MHQLGFVDGLVPLNLLAEVPVAVPAELPEVNEFARGSDELSE